MRVLSWAIILLILLPFASLAGFFFFSMVKSAVEDARRETSWRAWGYHAAFVAFLTVVACLFAYSLYLVVSILLSV